MRSSNATVCIGKPPPPWFWPPHLVFKERQYAATLLSLKEWPQPRFCCEVDSARIKLCHRVIKLYEVRNVPNLDLSYVVEKGAILLITSMGKKRALIHPWKIDILISSFGAQDYRVLYVFNYRMTYEGQRRTFNTSDLKKSFKIVLCFNKSKRLNKVVER